MSANDVHTLLTVGGLIVLGLLIIIIVVPLVGRLSLLIEAFSLLSEPLGDLFGNQRVVLLGCLVLGLVVAGCCVIALVAGSALLTCGSANPSGLCHMIGR